MSSSNVDSNTPGDNSVAGISGDHVPVIEYEWRRMAKDQYTGWDIRFSSGSYCFPYSYVIHMATYYLILAFLSQIRLRFFIP